MLLFRNSTSLVFSLMLSVVLFGIASGGFVASWWLRQDKEAHRYVGVVALTSGIVVIVTYFSFVDSMGLLSAATTSPTRTSSTATSRTVARASLSSTTCSRNHRWSRCR